MESLHSVIASMEKGKFLASLDIQDAYRHIPIFPSHQRFLRFAVQEQHFQIVALPFGLATAPRVFTKDSVRQCHCSGIHQPIGGNPQHGSHERGLSDSDENCKRFMERCMPEAFKKLLTSSAVHKWGTEIHEGIYNMLMLLVDLVAERIKQDPIPTGLLGVLTMAFNPDNEYHFKNRMKMCQKNWADVFGEGNTYAVSPPSALQKEPHGWLVDLVNRFGELGGLTAIQTKLNSEQIELAEVSALVQPLGVCAEYLNSSTVQTMLDRVIHNMIKYVQNVEEKDLKDKRLVSIPELLSAIKLLCMRFQPDLVNVVDDLRLDILLRMLKSPHFSAKMNSLKEVTKLIEDSTLSKSVKNAIDTDRLLDWLVENSVLSIALEGNIDQAQYCDRIKGNH
ncbi:unnamed protein product [Ranitomeya imitator]|uniref:UBP34/UBP24/USP9X/USP9Y-like ARM repeat region domain-containing protein n=1 Tax=Ranitomeya imitator TaxID=111125 RepID=A0ABN9MHP4_9NEOB|nr:unnamed protein product [Ranitomeya imitator]